MRFTNRQQGVVQRLQSITSHVSDNNVESTLKSSHSTTIAASSIHSSSSSTNMSSPSSGRTWILANHPKGLATFDSNDDSSTFKLVESKLPALEADQVLVKSLYFSNDPAQRPAIDASVKEERHYTKPVALGNPMSARGLGEVIESKSDKLPKGTVVAGSLNWREYAVLKAAECTPLQPLPNGLSWSHYLGAFGGTGLTAYYGLVEVGKAQKGQRIVVSGAAGATGSMVVQIAKKVSQEPLSTTTDGVFRPILMR
jgi:NADPH-dependent curcumin reductase CurA